MTTIEFKNGDLFESGIGKYDLCLYYGHHGMSFGFKYGFSTNEVFKQIKYPFTSHPNLPIEYESGKYLVCIPHDFMSDDEFKISLTYWLDFAKENKFTNISLNGVRDSAPILENDNDKINDVRVRFTLQVLEEWFSAKKSEIEKVLLISLGDAYTRNFPNEIIIN